MKKSLFKRRFAVVSLVLGFVCASLNAQDAATSNLVGTWAVEVGTVKRASGELIVDSKPGALQATFLDHATDSKMEFTGVVEGPDRIVFRSGKELRWSCNDIRRDSFVCRQEV